MRKKKVGDWLDWKQEGEEETEVLKNKHENQIRKRETKKMLEKCGRPTPDLKSGESKMEAPRLRPLPSENLKNEES